MKQAIVFFKLFTVTIVFCLPLLAAAQEKIFKMPDPINGCPTINSFFQKVFELNNATNLLKARVDALDKELTDKSPLDIDPLKMVAEYNDCSSLLTNLLPTITSFIETLPDMPSKVKDELSNKPFRIPGALLNVKRACSAIWDSKNDLMSMLKSVLPAAKNKLKEKKGEEIAAKLNNTDSSGTAALVIPVPAIPAPVIVVPESLTTTFIIEKIAYADAQPLMDVLKPHTKISGMTKSFSVDVATIIISHTSTAEDLTDYFLQTPAGSKFTVVEVSKTQVRLRVKQALK